MKSKIIELLDKIANGEQPPKIIIYKNKRYWYVNKEKDYYLDADYDEALFDSYVITDILTDEVEILETTIKPELGSIICYKEGETNSSGYLGVVEKINEDGSVCLKEQQTTVNNCNYVPKVSPDAMLHFTEIEKADDKKDKLKVTLNCIRDSETIFGGEYYIIHSDFINEIIEVLNEKCQK